MDLNPHRTDSMPLSKSPEFPHLLCMAALIGSAPAANPPELESAGRRFQSLLDERVERPFKVAYDRLSSS
jgi:hypothetical protein